MPEVCCARGVLCPRCVVAEVCCARGVLCPRCVVAEVCCARGVLWPRCVVPEVWPRCVVPEVWPRCVVTEAWPLPEMSRDRGVPPSGVVCVRVVCPRCPRCVVWPRCVVPEVRRAPFRGVCRARGAAPFQGVCRARGARDISSTHRPSVTIHMGHPLKGTHIGRRDQHTARRGLGHQPQSTLPGATTHLRYPSTWDTSAAKHMGHLGRQTHGKHTGHLGRQPHGTLLEGAKAHRPSVTKHTGHLLKGPRQPTHLPKGTRSPNTRDTP